MRMGLAPDPWNRLRRRSPELLLCLLLAPLLGGCVKPQILRFSTAPEVICPGDVVELDWETNGRVHLKATPEVEGLGARGGTGQQRVTVQGPTRFTLQVSRFLAGTQFTEQEVLSPPHELEYGLDDTRGPSPFTCSEQTGVLEAGFSLEDRHFSPRVSLGRVTNMNLRALGVNKGGVSETLPEGAGSSALAGQSAQGPWRLSVPLQPGERCADALESVSGRLIIKLQFSCPR